MRISISCPLLPSLRVPSTYILLPDNNIGPVAVAQLLPNNPTTHVFSHRVPHGTADNAFAESFADNLTHAVAHHTIADAFTHSFTNSSADSSANDDPSSIQNPGANAPANASTFARTNNFPPSYPRPHFVSYCSSHDGNPNTATDSDSDSRAHHPSAIAHTDEHPNHRVRTGRVL